MKYLKIVEGLDMYGVQYYSIKNKKNSDVWLGVDPVGFKVYEKEDKLTVKMCFPWTESKNIATTNKKFIIKHRYPGTPVSEQKLSLMISLYLLCIVMYSYNIYTACIAYT